MEHDDIYNTNDNIRRYYSDILDENVCQYKDSNGTAICAGDTLISDDGSVNVLYDYHMDDYVVSVDHEGFIPLGEYLDDHKCVVDRSSEHDIVVFYNIADLLDDNDCPIPNRWISDIPNIMGINLCSVRGVKVISQSDGQIKSIEIQFIPA